MKGHAARLIEYNQHLNQEIEERVMTEQTLKNSQHLLQIILDTIEGEVFIKDTNGKYLFVNKAFGKDFGVDPKDVIGKDDYFVFSSETAAELQENDKRILAAKKAVNIEESTVLKGKHATYLTNKVPLVDNYGNVLGICGVGFEITQQKKMEKALEKAYIDLEQRLKELEKETNKCKQTELEILESKKRYQRLVEDLGENFMIYSHRLDGTLTYTGPGIKSIFGISREKAIGSDWRKTIKWESRDLELAGDNIRNMVSGVEYKRMPMSFRHPDGKQRTVFISPHPIKNSEGSVIGVEGLVEDITERKKAEEELKGAHTDLEKRVKERTSKLSATVEKLREAELRYRTVANFTFDWEWWTNPDRAFNYVSPSCERITGYRAEEFTDDPKLLDQIVLPEDRNTWSNHQQEPIEEKKLREIQFRIRRKDGEIRWIEHACQQVVGDQGEFLGFRASNRDITERKQSEAKLQKSEKNLAKAQRLAKLGNWQWDILTNRLEWSNEIFRIFGLTPQQFDATYDAFLERVHPDDRNTVETAVNQALEKPSAGYDIQHRIVKSDGSIGFVHEHGEVTFDENVKPVRMIGTVQDISELKALEAESQQLRTELAHLDRVTTMGVMTAAITHEINQSLTANRSYAQAALRFLDAEQPDLENVRKALMGVIADNKRAVGVIDRIRVLVKKEESYWEAFDINAIIEEVLKLINSEIVLRNILITTDLNPEIPVLYGDPIQIQQVALNLLVNAFDAMDNQPEDARHILISTNVEGKKGIIVSVAQSGPEIIPDKFEKIFNAFYSTKPKGMGMGLAICLSIVETHGGQLWAENMSGGGARFLFSLPFGKGGD